MPTPPEFYAEIRARLIALVDERLPVIVDEVWDASRRATVERISQAVATDTAAASTPPTPEPARPPLPAPRDFSALFYTHPRSQLMSPQKRGAQNRAPKGLIKGTIRELIYSNPRGISREQIRTVAQTTKGLTIKDGSLKQGLRLLSKDGDIVNRHRMWFPTKTGDQSND